jgi:hypothetical protein
MKRQLFLIDASKKEEVKQWLNQKGIVWSNEARFYWHWGTAVVTIIGLGALSLLFGIILS